MTTREALEYARERLDSISYHLECTNRLPCRSFYEKQCEMLVQAVVALQEKVRRDEQTHEGP